VAIFELSLPFVLRHEGGYSDVSGDAGGATEMGVTQATLNAFNGSHGWLGFPCGVRDLTVDQVAVIYKFGFWRFDGFDSQQVACKVFDMDVNAGLPRAVKLLQAAINTLGGSLEDDGVLGPATIAAANACDKDALLKALVDVSMSFYEEVAAAHPNDEQFLAGWESRAKEIPDA